MKPGVNQTPSADFDPAAWQLKVIQLPSGGEIHVQYEQDEYLHVQDRMAEALVSIQESDASVPSHNKDGLYSLNTAEIGVTSEHDKSALAALINQRYAGDKIFFKFLYALIGESPGLDKCNSDYISGYVNFNSASYNPAVSTKIQISVGGQSSYSLPRDICLDLVKKQKGGKLDPTGNCNASNAGVSERLTVKSMVMQLLSKIGTSFFAQGTSCLSVKPEYSYFKIPVLHAKKGGGLRVKRILMYDNNGIDNGISSLYGSEYFYQADNGKSSGVSTNEPTPLRDENALITFLPKRNEQAFLSKIVSGTDREQFEGPVGETLLPSAAVGYSRIVTRNIHSGKTNAGFVVNEFYTVKDYPYDMKYNDGADAIETTSIDKEKDWMNLPAIIFNYSVSNVWASQGYRFMLNSMHGQPKTIATYSGDYDGKALVTYAKSSSTEYQYFQPGEKIDVLKPDGTISKESPGKDMEVAFELKSVEDITADASIEVDFGVGIAGIIPLPQASLSPTVNYTESKLRTHVTSKVIKYPVIQKAVISSQEGIVHKTENLVFSAYTGKPVRTRTTDGYDNKNLQIPSYNGQIPTPTTAHNGSFTSYTTPAYAEYKEMGQKAINERMNITPGLSNSNWQHITVTSSIVSGEYFLNFTAGSGFTVCNAMNSLTRGDLVQVNKGGSYFHIDEVSGSGIKILPAHLYNTNPNLPSGTNVTNIEIIKSGKTNQLSTPAGGYVTYGPQQAIVNHPADPIVTAQRQSFINALNNLIPNGGTINHSSFPFVVQNDAACTPLDKDIIVDPLQANHFAVHFPITNLVRNGDFVLHNSSCTSINASNEFGHGCVDSWSQCTGTPDYIYIPAIPPYADARMVTNVTFDEGIMQTINGLDPNKQYTLSFKFYTASAFFASGETDVYVGLADPLTSGLPRGAFSKLGSLPGQILFHQNSSDNTGASVVYYKVNISFTPIAGNSQLYFVPIDGSTIGKYMLMTDVKIITEECSTNLISNGNLTSQGNTFPLGHFDYNELGQILFYSPDNDCFPQVIDCFKFCEELHSTKTLANVVTSNASTFNCTWPYDPDLYPTALSAGNVYEKGEKGKWRVEDSYVYKTAVKGGSAAGTDERNYNDAGTYNMTMFNWKNPGANTAWTKTNTITKYSPNGDAMEEKDALGIYSAAKFGYNGTVPYAVAKNSNYDFVQFQSFEKRYTTGAIAQLEDGLNVSSEAYFNPASGNISHSGKGSYKLSGKFPLKLKPVAANSGLHGLSCKVWVKDNTWSNMPVKGTLVSTVSANSIPMSFVKIAQTGEWTLYEAKINSLSNGITYTPTIESTITSIVYLDDVRLQPLDAQVNCYVYEPATLRLLTSFDDQHFGLFYQYNAEGKLVRKMIETEKGMKTITETQYHTPVENRPTP
jgi:hypothetical protein